MDSVIKQLGIDYLLSVLEDLANISATDGENLPQGEVVQPFTKPEHFIEAAQEALDIYHEYSTRGDGEIWEHHSGKRYRVLLITNETATKDNYPVEVVYRCLEHGHIYSRPLDEWHMSFTEVK